MKTPISYYGGKQKMTRWIMKLIPQHSSYVEPFAGGAAVFWAKPPSKLEVLNDLFYRLLETLTGIEGKFLLSSYRNSALNGLIKAYGWDSVEMKMACSASSFNAGKGKKRKIEVLTANYPIRRNIESAQPSLELEAL
ncbi:hypothetical protein FACS1894172_09390 [Spirochaetia bacterium]|nr:hypothetical protein FACS1894172_09390 [Spirochaetia bacterium]